MKPNVNKQRQIHRGIHKAFLYRRDYEKEYPWNYRFKMPLHSNFQPENIDNLVEVVQYGFSSIWELKQKYAYMAEEYFKIYPERKLRNLVN